MVDGFKRNQTPFWRLVPSTGVTLDGKIESQCLEAVCLWMLLAEEGETFINQHFLPSQRVFYVLRYFSGEFHCFQEVLLGGGMNTKRKFKNIFERNFDLLSAGFIFYYPCKQCKI